LSRAGALDDLPDQQGHNLYPAELKDAWSAFRTRVQPLLYSIGRVNLIDGKHIGTGFVVGDGILATNRHVLDDLTFGTGVLAGDCAQVAFQRDGRRDRRTRAPFPSQGSSGSTRDSTSRCSRFRRSAGHR
jgi:hypothetical protein